jgi:hypothetical protein
MLNDKLNITRNNYISLLHSCLTGSLYRDPHSAPFGSNTFIPQNREKGLDWPKYAQTMIGNQRLHNLRVLMESIIHDNIPGDVIETGVWRGGACILMRGILKAYDVSDRNVWVADSFQGLPLPDELKYPADKGSNLHTFQELQISMDEVMNNFKTYHLLDDQIKFLKGWFKDTLPEAPISQLALMRLDGDMYESTMDGLVNLYPKLANGGYVIIDDYHTFPFCKAAVNDYCKLNNLSPSIIEIDGMGVFWRKDDNKTIKNLDKIQSGSSPSQEAQVSDLQERIIQLYRYAINILTTSLEEQELELSKLLS